MAETILTKKGKALLTNSVSKGAKVEFTKCLVSSYIGNLDAVESIAEIQVEDTVNISEIKYENGNIEISVFIPSDRGDYSVSTLCLIDSSNNLISLTRVQEFLKIQNRNEINYVITFSFENAEIVLRRDEKTPITKKILDETLISYSKITDIEKLAAKQDILALGTKTEEKIKSLNATMNAEVLNRQKSINEITTTITRNYVTKELLNNTLSFDYVTNSKFNDNNSKINNKLISIDESILKKLDTENFTIYKNSIDKIIETNNTTLNGKMTTLRDDVSNMNAKVSKIELDNALINQKIETISGFDDSYIKVVVDTNINEKAAALEGTITSSIISNNIAPLKNDISKLNLLTNEIKQKTDNNETKLSDLNSSQTTKNNYFDGELVKVKLGLEDANIKINKINISLDEANKNNLKNHESLKADIDGIMAKLPNGNDLTAPYVLVTREYTDNTFITNEEQEEFSKLLNDKMLLIEKTAESNKTSFELSVSKLDGRITSLETENVTNLEKITNNSDEVKLLKEKNNNLDLKVTNLENKTLVEKNTGVIISNVGIEYLVYFYVDVEVFKPVYICGDLKGLNGNGLKIKLENIICNNTNTTEKIINENGYFSFFVIPSNAKLGLHFATTKDEIKESNKIYVYQ